MPVLPDDEPDFAQALEALIQLYQYQWEVGTDEIVSALQRQIDLLAASVGTLAGFAPLHLLPTATPDPPE